MNLVPQLRYVRLHILEINFQPNRKMRHSLQCCGEKNLAQIPEVAGQILIRSSLWNEVISIFWKLPRTQNSCFISVALLVRTVPQRQTNASSASNECLGCLANIYLVPQKYMPHVPQTKASSALLWCLRCHSVSIVKWGYLKILK